MTIYKNFNYVIDSINKKSPLQKKKLESYLRTQPESFFNEADRILKKGRIIIVPLYMNDKHYIFSSPFANKKDIIFNGLEPFVQGY